MKQHEMPYTYRYNRLTDISKFMETQRTLHQKIMTQVTTVVSKYWYHSVIVYW